MILMAADCFSLDKAARPRNGAAWVRASGVLIPTAGLLLDRPALTSILVLAYAHALLLSIPRAASPHTLLVTPLTSLWITPACALTLFMLLVISGTAVATPKSKNQEWPFPGVSLLRCTYVYVDVHTQPERRAESTVRVRGIEARVHVKRLLF